jgi:hypothetical protein
MDLHPVPVSAVAHQFEMIVHGQITDGASKIVQEPVADRTGIDDASGDDWNKRKQIVTAPPFEFISQSRGPIKDFDFPTIGVQIFERLSCQRPGISDQRLDDLLPIRFENASVDWVEGISAPIVAASRNAGMIVERITDTQKLPTASGRTPAQLAIRIDFAGEVENLR